MKKIFTFLTILGAFSFNQSFAQLTQFRLGDLNDYVNAYTEPFAVAMPVGLSGGWAHTAKVHNTLGFDLTFSASLVKIPATASTFEANSVSLPAGATFSESVVPTLRADDSFTPGNINIPLSAGEGLPSTSLTFPAFKGLNLGSSVAGAIQLGVGLPKGTEVKVRFIPDLSATANNLIPEDTDISLEKTNLWGVGVKHDIKQWIPVVSKVPFLELSGLVSYTKFQTGFSGADLAVTPSSMNITNGELINQPELWDDQTFKMNASAFSGAILAGASIPVFQPFIGLGFNSGKFESGFYGTYPVVDVVANGTEAQLEVNETEPDPLIIEQKNTNFNFMAGARLKLGPIVFHYAYTLQEYNMQTFGFAVTIR